MSSGPPPRRYGFSIRWREELVCACEAGAFALDMPGHTEVLVPSESAWAQRVPAWVRDDRDAFVAQLGAWCRSGGHALTVWDQAPVYDA